MTKRKFPKPDESIFLETKEVRASVNDPQKYLLLNFH